MPIYQNNVVDNGLEVFLGSSYRQFIADSKTQQDFVDFKDAASNAWLLFPRDTTLAHTTEVLEQEYIGKQQIEKYLGPTKGQGDANYSATLNGYPYVLARVMGGHKKSDTDSGLMAVFSRYGCTLDYTRTGDQVSSIKITLNDGTESTVAVATDDTVAQVVAKLKAIDGIIAESLIGDDTLHFNILPVDRAQDVFSTIGFIACSVIADAKAAKLPAFSNLIYPKTGKPPFVNVLIADKDNRIGTVQFAGVEIVSSNETWNNQGLTDISTQMLATLWESFTGLPLPQKTDRISSVYSQTQFRARMYINGILADSISDIAWNFAWKKEASWNLQNKRFSKPNAVYTNTLSGNAMYNEQSKKFFYDELIDGNRISALSIVEAWMDGKKYIYIRWSKQLMGTPIQPTFAPGDITVPIADFVSVPVDGDPYPDGAIMLTDEDISLPVLP